MKETCRLTFRTSRGRNRVVTVANPRSSLSPSLVTNAANLMMTANPFDAETGTLDALLRAEHVKVTHTPIIVPPDAA